MMVFSTYKKQCILHFTSLGLKPPTIAKELQKEKIKCSRVSIYKFLKHFRETGSTGRKVGSGRPSKVTAEIKKIVDDQMRLNDETTAYQLHRLRKAILSVCGRYYDVEWLWAGHLEAAHTVNNLGK